MFWTGLAIGGHRREIGLHDLPYPGLGCVTPNVRRADLARAQRFAQAFKSEIEARASLVAFARALPVAEEIDDGAGRVGDADPHTLDAMLFHTRTQQLVGKANKLERRMRRLRPAVL